MSFLEILPVFSYFLQRRMCRLKYDKSHRVRTALQSINMTNQAREMAGEKTEMFQLRTDHIFKLIKSLIFAWPP